MPDRAVGAAQMECIVSRNRPLFDEQLTYRHHFPFDLLPLGAEVIVFAGRWIGIDLGNPQGAAVPPGGGKILVIGLPSI
jgi:hypothetical protein